MQNLLKLAVSSTLLLASGSAIAGGQAGKIGVGAEGALNGSTGGLSVNYDAGAFHVGGFFGYSDAAGPNNSDFSLGGRFFYHVHSTAMSDFGLGAGISLASIDGFGQMNDQRHLNVYIEPSAQIRLFLASNVALSFTLGFVVATADDSGVALGGQGLGQIAQGPGTGYAMPTAFAGVHYYFF